MNIRQFFEKTLTIVAIHRAGRLPSDTTRLAQAWKYFDPHPWRPEGRSQHLVQSLYKAFAGVDHERLQMTTGMVPKLELHASKDVPRSAMDLCIELERGDPSIASQAQAGILVFNPWCLRDGDVEKIAARVKPLLRY